MLSYICAAVCRAVATTPCLTVKGARTRRAIMTDAFLEQLTVMLYWFLNTVNLPSIAYVDAGSE